MNEAREELGQLIDQLDALAHAMNMPIPDATHVTVLRSRLPEIVKEMKAAFAKVTGENPWA